MSADSLVDWLRAQLDDEEAAAKAAGGDEWTFYDAWGTSVDGAAGTVVYDEGAPTEEQARHIAAWDPARVLAEVAAKRRVLELHEHVPASPSIRMYEDRGEQPFGCKICADNDGVIYPWGWCATVRLLALPFELRDGYRAEWMPE